jgi:hypothetical protein
VTAIVGAFLSFRASARAPILDYEIVNVFPHDPESFTQGLIFRDSVLFGERGSVRALGAETWFRWRRVKSFSAAPWTRSISRRACRTGTTG